MQSGKVIVTDMPEYRSKHDLKSRRSLVTYLNSDGQPTYHDRSSRTIQIQHRPSSLSSLSGSMVDGI